MKSRKPQQRTLRLLLLEDSPTDVEIVLYELRRAGFDPAVRVADSRKEYVRELEASPDLILADYTMPQFTAADALEILRERQQDIPFIVVTGTISEEVAVDCMKRGASDYLLKDRLGRLAAAVDQALEQRRLREEARRAEAALRESEERYRMLVQSMSEVVYQVEVSEAAREGKLKLVGGGVQALVGTSAERLLAHPGSWASLLHPDDVERMKTESMALARSGKPATRLYRIKHVETGEYRWVEDSVVPVTASHGKFVLHGVARDVSDRQRAEEELREAHARLNCIFEASPVAIITTDEAGNVTSWNQAAEQLFGWTAEEVVGGPPPVVPDQKLGERMELRQRIEGGEVLAGIETVRRRKDGSAIEVLLTGAPLYDTSDRFTGAVMLVQDITERKQSEGQVQRHLRQLAALHSIDLAITASLDLRVTLNVLLEQVTVQLAVDAAGILLVNPQTRMLDYAAGRGFRTSGFERAAVRVGEGYAGRSVLERRAITVPVISYQDPNWVRRDPLQAEGFVSYYAVPLIAKGQVKGLLEIFHRTEMRPDQPWLDFLETLAGQAALAIDNASLFDELQRSNAELVVAYDATLEGWVRALDLRDRETEGHSQRVTEMTVRLARQMGLEGEALGHIRRGALLHDIGKMAIPDRILHKPGRWTTRSGR